MSAPTQSEPATQQTGPHPEACANCQAVLAGPFCYSCGQKVRHKPDYSIVHFAHHALHDILHFDNKLFRTIRPLLFRPGFLTKEYFEGRQQRYMQPLALFIFINFLFFLLKVKGIFRYSLASFNSNERFTDLIARKVAASGLSFEVFEAQFNVATKYQQKGYFIFLVPLFALVLVLLFFRQKRYYVEHLIFALHFIAFFLVYMAVLPALLYGIFLLTGSKNGILVKEDDLIMAITLIVCSVYLFAAIRRMYGSSRWSAAPKALVLTVVFTFLIAYVYRFGLFYLVLNSIKQ